jgi:hypothetical protein
MLIPDFKKGFLLKYPASRTLATAFLIFLLGTARTGIIAAHLGFLANERLLMMVMGTVRTMHVTGFDFFLALLLLFHQILLIKKEWTRTLPCYAKVSKGEIASSHSRLL